MTAQLGPQIAKDHDPFDMFRAGTRIAFRLVPLIYSPGRDEDSGLYSAPDLVVWPLATSVTVNPSQPYLDAVFESV